LVWGPLGLTQGDIRAGRLRPPDPGELEALGLGHSIPVPSDKGRTTVPYLVDPSRSPDQLGGPSAFSRSLSEDRLNPVKGLPRIDADRLFLSVHLARAGPLPGTDPPEPTTVAPPRGRTVLPVLLDARDHEPPRRFRQHAVAVHRLQPLHAARTELRAPRPGILAESFGQFPGPHIVVLLGCHR